VDSESLGELIRVLGDVGVRSLVSQLPTLEELFLRHYGVDADAIGAGRDAAETLA
jgi:ABC-2 type transport system ATP-binding protein